MRFRAVSGVAWWVACSLLEITGQRAEMAALHLLRVPRFFFGFGFCGKSWGIEKVFVFVFEELGLEIAGDLFLYF